MSSDPIRLTNAQLGALRDALLSAFPSHSSLAQFARFRLDQRLDHLVGPDTGLRDAVYELITWADAHGQVPQLIESALAENPDNPKLKAFVDQVPPAQTSGDGTDTPRPLRWKELDEILSRWKVGGAAEAMSESLRSAGFSEPTLAAATAELAVTGFQKVLERIHHLSSPFEHEDRADEAALGADYLNLTADLLSRITDSRRFDLFTRIVVTERDADRSEHDMNLLHVHTAARRLLERLAQAAGYEWPRYDDFISKEVSLSGNRAQWGADVSDTVRIPWKAMARAEIISRLGRKRGFERMLGLSVAPQLGLMARLFLDPDEVIWHDGDLRAMLASQKSIVRQNARMVLHDVLHLVAPVSDDPVDWQLMKLHIESQPPYSVEWCVTRFVQNEGPLAAVWTAYAGGELSDDAVREVKLTRRKLILLGAPERALFLAVQGD